MNVRGHRYALPGCSGGLRAPGGVLLLALACALFGARVVRAQTPASASDAPTMSASVRESGAEPVSAHVGKSALHRKPAPTTATGPLYATRADVMREALAIAQSRALDPQWVRHAIGQARYSAAVAQAITPVAPGVAKNWQLYRSRFIEPVRIQAGLAFWRANEAALLRAQAQTGVPPSLIVGILGVETLYGQQTGHFRVLDALCTLAFDFPAAHPKAQARAAYFRSELEEYLVLTRRSHTDPLALKGSYAGAMGMAQFMPSSWARYGVNFAGGHRVDLFHNREDIIRSVANYFQAFHWQPGLPTHFAVRVAAPATELDALLRPDLVPSFSAAELAAHGVLLDADAAQFPGPLALVQLQNGDAPEQYVAATANFYAVTRYNWSSYYAMAVLELGQAVQEARAQPGKAASVPK